MTFDPDRRNAAARTYASRLDPRGGGPGRWISYAIGLVLLVLVLLWLFGAFDSATDTVTDPAAPAVEGAAPPVAPAAPQ